MARSAQRVLDVAFRDDQSEDMLPRLPELPDYSDQHDLDSFNDRNQLVYEGMDLDSFVHNEYSDFNHQLSHRREIRLESVVVAYNSQQPEFEQEKSCTFCYEQLANTSVVTLPCSDLHVFHFRCIEKWLTTNPNCPICRGNVTDRPRQAIGNVFIFAR